MGGSMAVLEFVYKSPPSGMSDITVLSGHISKEDKTAILRQIDREWSGDLSTQARGTRTYKLDDEMVEFEVESQRDEANLREPKMRFKAVKESRPTPNRDLRAKLEEASNAAKKVQACGGPSDGLEDVILAYVRQQRVEDPERLPAAVVAEIGKIV